RDAVPDVQATLRIGWRRCWRSQIGEETGSRGAPKFAECSDPELRSPGFRLARKLNNRAKFLQKFFAQAIKAPLGHHENEIARFGLGTKMFRGAVRAMKHDSVFGKRTDGYDQRT